MSVISQIFSGRTDDEASRMSVSDSPRSCRSMGSANTTLSRLASAQTFRSMHGRQWRSTDYLSSAVGRRRSSTGNAAHGQVAGRAANPPPPLEIQVQQGNERPPRPERHGPAAAEIEMQGNDGEDTENNVEVVQDEGAVSVVSPRFSPSNANLVFVAAEDIADQDIFCGREYRGSDHPGNVEYLRIIRNHKKEYSLFGSQHSEKTRLRNSLVDNEIQGRFIKRTQDGRFCLLTKEEARKKVGQALREGR